MSERKAGSNARLFRKGGNTIMKKCNNHFEAMCLAANMMGVRLIDVMSAHAINKYGTPEDWAAVEAKKASIADKYAEVMLRVQS